MRCGVWKAPPHTYNSFSMDNAAENEPALIYFIFVNFKFSKNIGAEFTYYLGFIPN